MTPGNAPSRTPLLPVLFIVLVATFLVYLPSMKGQWQLDDFHHIRDNTALRSAGDIPSFFTDPGTFSNKPRGVMYRPVTLTVHALNYLANERILGDGYSLAGFHLASVVLHLACTCLVFFLGLLLAGGLTSSWKNAVYAAAAAALLFGLHPVHSETVTYISARSSMLATFFVLAASVIHVRGRLRGHHLVYLVPANILFFAGLLSKEIAVTLPLLLIVYEATLGEGDPETSKGVCLDPLRRTASYFLTAAVFLVIRYLLLGENLLARLVSKGGPAAAPDLPSQLGTQAKVVYHYIQKTLVPMGLSFDTTVSISRGPGGWTIPAAMGLVAMAAGVFLIRKKQPLVAFAAAWFFVSLLPTSLMRLSVPASEHRLYLPLAGFSLMALPILGWALNLPKKTRSAVMVGLSTVVLAFSALTVHRLPVYWSQESLWADTVRKHPDSYRANINLGLVKWEKWELGESLKLFTRARELAPEKPDAYIQLAAVYNDLGRREEALESLQTALRLAPDNVPAHLNLARLLKVSGKLEEAEPAYRRTLALDGQNVRALTDLGHIYLLTGRVDQSIQMLARAYSLDPYYADAALYYARALAAKGDRPRARAVLGNVTRLLERSNSREAELLKRELLLLGD